MRRLILTVVTILFCSVSFAQLSIQNPKHLNIPENEARALLRMSCRAVAHELHLRESSTPELEMQLILGDREEGFGYDAHTGVPTLFLQEWNEKKFVTAATSFAVQRSISQPRQEQIVSDVLHRHQQSAPISAAQLHKFAASESGLAVQPKDDCLSQISNATVRHVGCDGLPRMKTR